MLSEMSVTELNVEDFTYQRIERGKKTSYRLKLSHPNGNELPIEIGLPVLVVAGESEGPSLLVLAGVHGDEYEGVQTVLRLYELLQPKQLHGQLVMIPTANPLAYRSNSRCSPEDGRNLARTFPGKIDGTITERLAYEWHHRFIAEADFLLDLHSGGTQYQIATLTGYYHNEQSELGRASRKAAEAFGIPLLWGHTHIAAGRSISSAQSLGIPWLYTEAYGGGRIRPEDAAHFFNGTLRLMNHLGMLKLNEAKELLLPPEPQSSFHTIYGDGNFDQSALCKQDGFFIPEVHLMHALQAGEPIGAIYDISGRLVHKVYAGKSGYLVMLAGGPVVKKGDPLYMIA